MLSGRYLVFGTAGHVDHGKSALVLALTGTDPDRLAEEKAREMTIDLGFAFLSLPGMGEPAAIVDVPGHEMFIRNMVAGAAGVDAAIFVVAADEGVMPQTLEHLDVLRYLGVATGVVALTKSDRASPEMIRIAVSEVEELTRGTFLEGTRIIPVSARTGDGLEDLRAELARIAAGVRTRSATGAFRLPIDRVFTMKGAGTVVTGTVISGSMQVGESVSCLPAGKLLRVRGLQVHNQPVTRVSAGQRAAINLADIAKDDLGRGDMLVGPGSMAPTLVVDARVTLSPQAPKPLEHRTRIRVHHGAREVMARTVLLDREALALGESALVQLRLETPLIAAAGDRFVIRSYSPMRVTGGGTIVEPHPPKRRRQSDAQGIAEREMLPPQEALTARLERAGPRGATVDQLRLLSGLSEQDLRDALEVGVKRGELAAGRRDLWFARAAILDMGIAICERLAAFHAAEPLLPFAPLATVTASVAATPDERECFRLALDALVKEGEVVVTGGRVRLAAHRPQWEGSAAQARDKILDRCRDCGAAGPTVKELAASIGFAETECQPVVAALVETGELCALAGGMYLHRETLAHCRDAVRQHLVKHGRMTVAQCRDFLGVSRKYLLPLLELLDEEGLTLRQGDYRVLRPHPQ